MVLVDGIVEVTSLSVLVILLSVVEIAVVTVTTVLVDGIVEVTSLSVLVIVLSVVEIAVVSVTTVLVDGVVEVTFSFTHSSLQ